MRLDIRTTLNLGLICLTTITQAIPAKSTPSIEKLISNYESWDKIANKDLATITGIHVIYSWPGATIPQELYDLTHEGKVGGVIIFGENVVDDLPDQIEKLQNTYSNSPAYIGKPLLITTDQEGGEVVRLPGGPKRSAKDVGSAPNPAAAAKRAGTVAAAACQAYSVNGNLAPVLDVYRKEGNFDDQYERSFSMDPDVVSTCGSAFIKSQQSKGVVATAKHFPGLGAAVTDENTDLGPVTLNVPLRKLRSIDEVPFKGAIAAGVDMIMTSWAVYPALDADRPAGLSSKWIQDELRGRLGFDGVTITDALEAGSLDAYGSNATRGVLAVQAGMDVALASGRSVEQGSSINEALVAALQNGKISKADFSKSTKRIFALRDLL